MAAVYQVTYLAHTKTGKPIERSAKVTADHEHEVEWELRNPRRTSCRNGRRGTRAVDSVISYKELGPDLKIVAIGYGSNAYIVSIRETDEVVGFVEPVGVPDFTSDYHRRRYVHTGSWEGCWYDKAVRDPETMRRTTHRTEPCASREEAGWALVKMRAVRQEA